MGGSHSIFPVVAPVSARVAPLGAGVASIPLEAVRAAEKGRVA